MYKKGSYSLWEYDIALIDIYVSIGTMPKFAEECQL